MFPQLAALTEIGLLLSRLMAGVAGSRLPPMEISIDA